MIEVPGEPVDLVRMGSRVSMPPSATRLFATYAIAALIPVVALGAVLADTYHDDASARGLSEGRAEVALLARTSVDPLLTDRDLRAGLTAGESTSLQRMSRVALGSGQILRLRIRDLDGRVVFATDPSGTSDAVDDEALDAAHGKVIAHITHLDADEQDEGTQGAQVAEVYQPLLAGSPSRQVGVLEVYLPYSPIARDVSHELHALYLDLAVGLIAMYLLLAAISWSVTRRLRTQVRRNAFIAEHDALTGLPNRALFRDRVSEAIDAARGDQDGVTVALIDLDRFKEVNDTLGHGNGDRMLCELGRRLADAIRPGDTIARLGGDEFGVVVRTGGGTDGPYDILERLLHVLQQELEVSGLPLSADASIGFAVWPVDGTNVETLLQHADIAMYVAKTSHSGIVRYDQDHDQYDANKLALLGELRRAIVSDELRLHYQPKSAIADGVPVGVEALLRWEHPSRGLVSPDEFLPIAEQTGVIDDITRWVLATALRQLDAWGEAADGLSVAVNVSARNICREGFADSVLGALDERGMSPRRLIVEITETALVTDPERAGENFARLAAEGVRISLDDFGCGQTSLSYLSTLPLHEVKIDRSFVGDMLTQRSHYAIVRSVVDLAHNLGFDVVAEGVETEDVLNALGELGCDIAQGYHLARPMPPDRVPGWLRQHRTERSSVGLRS